MNLRFVIRGNHESKQGNPCGYNRTTQKSYWNKQSRRYYEWKQYVVSEFVRQTRWKEDFNKKPIPKSKQKIFLHIKIYFKNKKHGDPDNIQKGIADSLFEEDKYVAGSYDFFYDKENPRVEVEIKRTTQ